MIILDFETNSTNIHDVIEAAAFQIKRSENGYEIVDTFHRYYESKHPVNPHSLKVHKLSPEIIKEKRQNASYEKHFVDDRDFVEFCSRGNTLIAHNINFELRHIGELVKFKNHYCTMKENRTQVKAKGTKGQIKMPKLIEVCNHYKIEFDEESYHSAIYDVTKTLEILNMMFKIRNN